MFSIKKAMVNRYYDEQAEHLLEKVNLELY